MSKKVFSLALGAMLFAFCGSVDAQQVGKILPHRFSGFEQCFRYGRAFGGVPAGVEQVWMD